MKKNIVVDIPLNIDLSPYIPSEIYVHAKLKNSFIKAQTKEWLETRISLFMKYAGNSLMHQTNQDFICIVRHTKETKEIIDEILKSYQPLSSNIIFTDNAQSIIDRSIKEAGNLYRVIIDSDNMYHKEFIHTIHGYKHLENTQTLLCQNGYIYDERTERVASMYHPCPSFYVAIYDEKTYETLFMERLFEDHWCAQKYPYELIEGRQFCITTHTQNVDNNFDTITRGNRFRPQLLNEEDFL